MFNLTAARRAKSRGALQLLLHSRFWLHSHQARGHGVLNKALNRLQPLRLRMNVCRTEAPFVQMSALCRIAARHSGAFRGGRDAVAHAEEAAGHKHNR